MLLTASWLACLLVCLQQGQGGYVDRSFACRLVEAAVVWPEPSLPVHPSSTRCKHPLSPPAHALAPCTLHTHTTLTHVQE
jgi:hypothetical protein